MDENNIPTQENNVLKFDPAAKPQEQAPAAEEFVDEISITDSAISIAEDLGFVIQGGISPDSVLYKFAEGFNSLVKETIYRGYTTNTEVPAAYTLGGLMEIVMMIDKDQFEEIRSYINSHFMGVQLVDFFSIVEQAHAEFDVAKATLQKVEEIMGQKDDDGR